ncbi:MAG TPA: SgcJ/EcaC family oxidoreductase [Rhodanobacteraceae bacterium]|nr:SgcJ/EcaC family oxidoreductase [Rhodanobacteraceae bacterium]
MKYLPLVFLIGLSLASSPTFAQTPTDATAVAQAKQAIRQQFKRFAKALEQGDAGTVANIYASDAILLLPDMEPIKGRAALRSFFANSFKQVDTVSYKYTVHQLEVEGNWAFGWGEATGIERPKNPKMGTKTEYGHLKFIDIWKKGSDGKWHIYRDSSVIDSDQYTNWKMMKAIHLPAIELERYVGTYQLAPQFFLTIALKGDQLTVQATGQPAFPIFPATKTEFFAKAFAASFTFKVDDKGNATGLVLHQDQGGRNQSANKIK